MNKRPNYNQPPKVLQRKANAVQPPKIQRHVVQPKPMVAPPAQKLPVAPPAYRPQPTPKVLQRKAAVPQRQPATSGTPAASQPYRPIPTPRCLQTKKAVTRPGNTAPAARPKPMPPRSTTAQPKSTIQRFAWAIHYGMDMKRSEIVDANMERAQVRYKHVERTVDPDQVDEPQRPYLNEGEVIHLHAHGNDESFAGFRPDSLAWELYRKFDAEDLVGRVIVMHSCSTAGIAEKVLEELANLTNVLDRVSLVGTTIYAPDNYLVVDDDGISYVAKPGTDDSELRTKDRGKKLLREGEGWRGWTVGRDGSVNPILNPGQGVSQAMNLVEKAKVKKYKPKKKKVKQEEPTYGYYDDPRNRLNQFEESMLFRAMSQGRYPPK